MSDIVDRLKRSANGFVNPISFKTHQSVTMTAPVETVDMLLRRAAYEIESLRKDAARYHYIKHADWSEWESLYWNGDNDKKVCETLDAAIDAARGEKK